jgi:hypothetical protein
MDALPFGIPAMSGAHDPRSPSSPNAPYENTIDVIDDEVKTDHQRWQYQLYPMADCSSETVDDKDSKSETESLSTCDDGSSDYSNQMSMGDDNRRSSSNTIADDKTEQESHRNPKHDPSHMEQNSPISGEEDDVAHDEQSIEEYDVIDIEGPVIAYRKYNRRRQYQDPSSERIYEMFDTLSTVQNREFRGNYAAVVIDKQEVPVGTIEHPSLLLRARAEVGSSLRIGNRMHKYDSTEPSCLGPNRAQLTRTQRVIRKVIARSFMETSELVKKMKEKSNKAKAGEEEAVERCDQMYRKLEHTLKVLDSAMKEIRKEKHKRHEARLEITQLEEEISNKSAQIDYLTREKTAIENKVAIGAFDGPKVIELELQVKDVLVQLTHKEGELDKRSQEVDDLITELDRCASSVQDLQIEIEKQNGLVCKLTEQKNEIEKRYDQDRLWNCEYLRINEHLQKLFSKHPNLSEQAIKRKFEEFYRDWKDRFVAIEAKYRDELVERFSRESTVQTEQYESIVCMLHAKDRELRQARRQLGGFDHKCLQHKTEMERMKDILSEVESELRASRKEIVRIESLNTALIIKLNHAQNERNESYIELEDAKEETVTLYNQINTLKSHITELELEIKSLCTNNDIAEEKIKIMQLDIDNSASRMTELDKDIKTARQDRDSMYFQLEDQKLIAEDEILILHEKLANAVESFNNESTRQKEWITDLLKENEDFVKQCESFKDLSQQCNQRQRPVICLSSTKTPVEVQTNTALAESPYKDEVAEIKSMMGNMSQSLAFSETHADIARPQRAGTTAIARRYQGRQAEFGSGQTCANMDVRKILGNKGTPSISVSNGQSKLIMAQLYGEMKLAKKGCLTKRHKPSN